MGKSRREKSELSCISGLFTILDSHHSCASCKPISNARPGPNSLIIDYSRKLDQCSRFDEECRKIQYGENMGRSLRDLVREDIYVERKRYEQMAIMSVQCSASHCKGLSKKSRKAYDLSLYELNRLRSRGSKVGPTSFSIKKILKHTKDGCIHGGVDAATPLTSSKENNIAKNQRGLLHLGMETNSVRKKIDFSSMELKKHGVDAVLEANRLISARLIDHLTAIGRMSEGSPTTLEKIVSSLDDDCWPLSSRRDSQQMRFRSCSGTPIESQRICLSPMRTNATSCDDHEEYNHTMEEVKMEERKNVIDDEDDSTNTNTNTGDDVPSTPTSKYQEEQLHESPVSVLDQFFTQDIKTPSTNIFQTGRDQLKARRLCFEESSMEALSPEEYISQYVHLVIQSCSLTWDELAKMMPVSEERLLDSSLFNEVGYLISDPRFDTRLVFDHINEVVSEMQRSHSSKLKMTTCCASLEEAVVDEVMREAESYLLVRTHKTTLDQLVSKDIADCKLWVDFSSQNKHIVLHVAEHILHDSILDVILETLS